MARIIIIIVYCLLMHSGIFSQADTLSPVKAKRLAELMDYQYMVTNSLLNELPKETDYGIVDQEERRPFPVTTDQGPTKVVWETFKKEVTATIVIDTLETNGELSYRLNISPNLPEKLSVNPLQFTYVIKSVNLKDATGNTLRVKHQPRRRLMEITSLDKIVLPITGSVSLMVEYSNDYDAVTITKAEIGETVELRDRVFNVLEVTNNQAFLQPMKPDQNTLFYFLNTNDEGFVIKPDYVSISNDNSSLNQDIPFRTTISLEEYEFALNHPGFTKKMYSSELKDHYLNKDKLPLLADQQVIVVTTSGHIQNLALYLPKIAKVGTVNLEIR